MEIVRYLKDYIEEYKSQESQIQLYNQFHDKYNKEIQSRAQIDTLEKKISIQNINSIYSAKYFIIEDFGIVGLNEQFHSVGREIFPSHTHGGGDMMQSKRLYIVGGCGGIFWSHCGRNGYLYDFTDLTKAPLSLELSDYDIVDCYFRTDNIAICCTPTGDLIKVEIDNDLNISHTFILQNPDPWNPSINIVNIPINICKEITINEQQYILLGGESDYFYILNELGSLLKEIYLKEGDEDGEKHYTYNIEEIRPGLIISADDRAGSYLHDLRNLPNVDSLPKPKKLTVGKIEISVVLRLQLGDPGYYAAAGAMAGAPAGLIQINKLNDDLSSSTLKKKDNLSKEGCDFITIKEVEPGKILVLGDWDCHIGCTWEYMVDEEPECFAFYPSTCQRYYNCLLLK